MCLNLTIYCSQKVLCTMQKKRRVKTVAQLAYHTELFLRHLETEYLSSMCFFALQLGWISFCIVMTPLCVILFLFHGSL